MVTFDEYLKKELEDPEGAAYFANAQAESAQELLKAGIIKGLTIGSLHDKAKRISWKRTV